MRRARAVALTLSVAVVVPFAPAQSRAADPQLTVRVTGAGRVTSSPAGIDCPGACTHAFPPLRTGAQTVQLTATPDAGQALQGWGQSCAGNGPCAVAMTTSKVVSAAFGPAPPPTPEPTGTLTVEPTAGGSVAGLAGAIACPPDCSEKLPLGSAFDLSPTARSGFVFARWEGACSGAGACGGSIVPATFVKAVFEAVPPKERPATQDADGDGVPDARDACPGTAPGAKPGTGGCGPTDVVRDPADVLGPVRSKLGRARLMLRFVPGIAGVLRRLTSASKLLDSGESLAEAGTVCAASRTLSDAAAELRRAGAGATKTISALETSVFATRLPAAFGDTAEKDIQIAELHYRQGLLNQALAAGGEAAKSFGGACSSLGKGNKVVRGRVKRTDDASGIVTLTTGKRILLPSKRKLGDPVAEGADVRATGSGGAGRSPLVALAVQDGVPAKASPVGLSPCMKLRIAPFQDFTAPNPILHDPAGYRKNGELWLEGGMRVAASPKCASGTGRYSLAIELLNSNGGGWTLATDMTTGDDPASLIVLSAGGVLTLRVHERRQGSNCPPGQTTPSGRAAKAFPCPVVEQSVTDYKVHIKQVGSYATAVYSGTKFPLDVDAPSFVTVTGLTKSPTLPAATAFAGEGYNTTGTVNTGNYDTLVLGQQWTLYPKELYGFDTIGKVPMPDFGVDHFAGLLWPRVTGTRNGKPFRYAARLPAIVTDVLAFCPDQGEDCYYAPPWPYLGEKSVVQGNGPNAFSHNGNQLYAFDFGLATGDEIRAARGGIVGDVVEDLTKNYDPCVDPAADGPANYVRIDHQDGTYAYYVHLKTNTVSVQVGDDVGRGTLIGQADNTGRSCGPHLHFQTSLVKSNTYYGQTTQILFDTLVKGQASPYSQPCYLPQGGDTLISTNG